MKVGDRVKFARWYPVQGYATQHDKMVVDDIGLEGVVKEVYPYGKYTHHVVLEGSSNNEVKLFRPEELEFVE